MDAVIIGIDVCKDRLDVYVRPSLQSFAVVARMEQPADRLKAFLAGPRPELRIDDIVAYIRGLDR